MCGRPVATNPENAEAKQGDLIAIREAIIVALAREVGLRAAEIAQLRWSDVHLDEKLIVLELPEGRRRLALTTRASSLLAEAKKLVTDASVHVFPSPRTSKHVSIRIVQQVLRGVRSSLPRPSIPAPPST